jgi:hypothetical protein
MLDDIYDAGSCVIQHITYDIVLNPMELLVKLMIQDQPVAHFVSLTKAMARKDFDLYLHCDGLYQHRSCQHSRTA